MARLISVGLVAMTLWAYRSVWTAAWVYEDINSARYGHRPLTTATWDVIDSPLGAHLLNLSLHVLLAAVVLRFAQRLGVRGFGLWAVAVLWLLHPLNVETAAYAASRGELLAAIFLVTACSIAAGAWWRWPSVLAMSACLVAAMLSKESAVVGLLLVPFVIWAVAPLGPRWAPRWVPGAIAALLIAGGVFWYGGLSGVINVGGTDFTSATAIVWYQWVGLQAAAAQHWLTAFVWLAGLTPDPDLDLVSIGGRWLAVAVLALLACLAWLSRRTEPLVAFGIAWGLLALLPRFIVQTPQSYLNAHQFTVPLVGFVLVAACGVEAFARWCATPGEVRDLMADWRTHHLSAHL